MKASGASRFTTPQHQTELQHPTQLTTQRAWQQQTHAPAVCAAACAAVCPAVCAAMCAAPEALLLPAAPTAACSFGHRELAAMMSAAVGKRGLMRTQHTFTAPRMHSTLAVTASLCCRDLAGVRHVRVLHCMPCPPVRHCSVVGRRMQSAAAHNCRQSAPLPCFMRVALFRRQCQHSGDLLVCTSAVAGPLLPVGEQCALLCASAHACVP